MNEGTASIRETLKSVFGFDDFREGQEPVIRQLLAGHSALAVFPTGSGKSLCYQLTALHLEGVTIVVSPLIALMKDQVEFLREHHVAAARLDSSIKFDEARQIDADLQAGKLKLLYVAPERFSNERFVHKLRRLKISLMVIDEAHCISEWGHNFRPDYLKLARESRKLGIAQVLALTATATPSVAADICREFEIRPEAFVHTGFYRPNLTLHVSSCASGEQMPVLLKRLGERPTGYTIGADHPEAFYDVTTGDNACGAGHSIDTVNCCDEYFSAAAGWDAVNGLGSPKFGVIANLVLNSETSFPAQGAILTEEDSVICDCADGKDGSDGDDSDESLAYAALAIAIAAAVIGLGALVYVVSKKPASSSTEHEKRLLDA